MEQRHTTPCYGVLFSMLDLTVFLVAFLGGSPWDSTGQPLLLVNPDCLFIEQLPGSDIQNGCLFVEGGRVKQWCQPRPSANAPVGDLPNQNQAMSSMEMETHTNHIRKALLE